MTYTVCVLGLDSVGKSSFTIRYAQKKFISSYDPTFEEAFSVESKVEGEEFHLKLIDTAGHEMLSPLNRKWLLDADAFIFCYDITSKDSLVGLQKYIETTLHYNSGKQMKSPNLSAIPAVMIGCKCDLENEREVSKKEGEKFAIENLLKLRNPPKKVDPKMPFFLETSAKKNINIQQTIESLMKQIMSERDYLLSLKTETSKKSFFGSFISSGGGTSSTSELSEIDDFLKKSPTKK
eukprot:gene7593-11916_t